MKVKAVVFTAAIVLAFNACNNFFHELVPSDGNSIEYFSVPGQLNVEVGANTIAAYVYPGTDLTNLLPSIRVSDGATLLPVTYEYVSRAFGDGRTFGAAMELYTSGNMTDTVVEMIRGNKNFSRPALDLPINFGYSVDFIVISGLGTIRQYKVRVEIDTGEGKFTSFKFDKFYNPEVVIPAVGTIDTVSKTVTVSVSYPVENIASYQLTPSFETNGARVYLEGRELRSGETLIDFVKPPDSLDLSNPTYATQSKNLTLRRAGYDDSIWTLVVNFREDPSTNRSIIDFRFTKARNPLISADHMADIVNSGDTGTINVTVYYSGLKPEELRADFVSPGTVTVGGVMQTSGYSTHDFSGSLQYVVTSRTGGYVRTYTVTVSLVPASDPLPQITHFGFSTLQNLLLASNSTAMIDHSNRIILIEAAYDGATPPVFLIPDFSATGTVTVNGVTQTSGFSGVNFSGPVGYVVTNPSNPTLKREYRVEVKFVKGLSSVAEITSFSFYKADNPGLIEDVHATVNQLTGAITATLLFETPGGNRTLVPRWSAQGRVEAGGITQTSGGSSRQFYTPQGYRAVSVDGILQRNYTVTIKEVNSRIYVRENATGRNDGTDWQNAYQNLQQACSDSNLFPNNVPKEIWVAAGTYKPSTTGNMVEYFLMTANTGYIGGFAGYETAKSQRNTAANKVIISGDLGGGVYSYNLFGRYNGNTYETINGDIAFEDLEFTAARTPTTGIGDRRYGTAFFTSLAAGCAMNVRNCTFNNLQGGNGFYIGASGSSVRISNTEIKNISASHGFVINGRNIVIEDVYVEDIPDGRGMSITLSGSMPQALISRCTIKNIKSSTTGGGIYLSGPGNAEISNSVIENVESSSSGGGIYASIDGQLILSNTTITKARASSIGGGVFVYRGTFIMNGGKISDNTATNGGGGVYASHCQQLKDSSFSYFEPIIFFMQMIKNFESLLAS